MNLALKYRPRVFEDVAGQKAISVILKAMITKEKLNHALLFSGPSGTGKTSMARIVAASLNPGQEDDVHNGTHPSIIEIDAASNGSVASLRNLKEIVGYQVPGHRVIIIDEAHSISHEGFDVLLNMLEFPEPQVTYILCTTEPQDLPKAIRHRCDHYSFTMATPLELAERLFYINSAEELKVSKDLINLIAMRSEGSYREAVMLLDHVSTAGVHTVEQFNEVAGDYDIGPALIKSATQGPGIALGQLESVLYFTNSEEIIDQVIGTLRDLIVLHSGAKLHYTGKALDDRIELANSLDSVKIVKAMQVIWDLQTKMKNAESVRNLELAFSILGSVLQTVAVPLQNAENSTPMSISAMQNYGKN